MARCRRAHASHAHVPCLSAGAYEVLTSCAYAPPRCVRRRPRRRGALPPRPRLSHSCTLPLSRCLRVVLTYAPPRCVRRRPRGRGALSPRPRLSLSRTPPLARCSTGRARAYSHPRRFICSLACARGCSVHRAAPRRLVGGACGRVGRLRRPTPPPAMRHRDACAAIACPRSVQDRWTSGRGLYDVARPGAPPPCLACRDGVTRSFVPCVVGTSGRACLYCAFVWWAGLPDELYSTSLLVRVRELSIPGL